MMHFQSRGSFLSRLQLAQHGQPILRCSSLPPPSSSSSSEMNPMSPPRLLEEEHVLSCWGESFHFPEHFAKRKIFFISKRISACHRLPQCHRLITCHDAGLPIWEPFTLRGLEVPPASFPWPESKWGNYSFTRGPSGMTFSFSCFVVAYPRRGRIVGVLTSAVFSLSLARLGETLLTSTENSWTEPRGFSSSHLQTFRCRQHMWGRWQDENIPRQIVFIIISFMFFYWSNTSRGVSW